MLTGTKPCDTIMKYVSRMERFWKTEERLRLPYPASKLRGGVHMYAIIETGGKQYKVAEGDIITVEKLGVEAGQEYTCLSLIHI